MFAKTHLIKLDSGEVNIIIVYTASRSPNKWWDKFLMLVNNKCHCGVAQYIIIRLSVDICNRVLYVHHVPATRTNHRWIVQTNVVTEQRSFAVEWPNNRVVWIWRHRSNSGFGEGESSQQYSKSVMVGRGEQSPITVTVRRIKY